MYGDILDSSTMAAEYLEKMCLSLLALDEKHLPSSAAGTEAKGLQEQ
jgi:hypothetical protein